MPTFHHARQSAGWGHSLRRTALTGIAAFFLALCVTRTAMAQSYLFDYGSVGGWTMSGAWSDGGGGPFTNSFSALAWDDTTDYPTGPAQDATGDAVGAIRFSSAVSKPVPSASGSFWIMRLHSPSLATDTEWQKAVGYSVQLYRTLGPSAVYANLYVAVFDYHSNYTRYFYSGAAQTITNSGWNRMSFDWGNILTFPTSYRVDEIFVNIWGAMSGTHTGNVWLDDVVAVTDTTLPAVTIITPTDVPSYFTTSGTVDLGGSASDNTRIALVTWTNDRGGNGTATGTNNWSATNITLQAGVNVITVTARDAVQNTQTDAITVTYNSSPPTLTSVSTLAGAVEDTDFTISYATLAGAANEADADGGQLSFRVDAVSSGTLTKGGQAVVPGTTLLGAGESVVWRPALNANGVLNAFTVKAWDGTYISADPAVQVTVDVAAVNDAPELTVPANQTISELVPFSAVATATDVDLPAQSLTFGLVSGPGGLTVSPSGAIDWTPTEAQGPSTNLVRVKVTDDGTPALSATNSFTLTVTEVNTAPELTVPANQTIGELVPFSAVATATDVDLPAQSLVFDLVSGPTDLTVSPSGAIDWTPTEAQGPSTNLVRVKVTDNGTPALSATNSFTLTVTEVNTAPELTVPANQTISELVPFSAVATATDVDLPAQSLTFGLVSGPGGLTMSPSGAIDWTPTEAQGPSTNLVRVKVTDDGTPALSATNSFTLTVAEVNTAPTLTSVSTLAGAVEDTDFTISYATLAGQADEADADGDLLSFRVETVSSGTLTKGGLAVVPGVTLLGTGESLVWRPALNANGVLNALSIRAWDGVLASADPPVMVTVSVAAVDDAPTLTNVSTLTGAVEETDFTISYAALAGAADEADGDGDPLSFRVEAVSSGTLTKGGVAVVPGVTLLGTGESLVWAPPLNLNGAVSVFTVKAWDGALASADPAAAVTVNVAAANWQYVTVPNLPVGLALGRLWMRSRTDGYLWGWRVTPGTIDVPESFLYRWNGTSWNRLTHFPGVRPGWVFGTGATEVWVSAYACPNGGGRIYRSIDSGTTWVDQDLRAWLGTGEVYGLRGTAGNVHAAVEGGQVLRFDGTAWSRVFEDAQEAVSGLAFVNADEGYFASSWGWGRWGGSSWTFNGRQSLLGEVRDMWAVRQGLGPLSIWAAGNGGWTNGVCVWRFDGVSLAAELQEGSVPGQGTASGVWGTVGSNGVLRVYVVGELGASRASREGVVYRYDGSQWTQMSRFGRLAPAMGVSGTAVDDVWLSLMDGQLLHLGPAGPPVAPYNIQPRTNEVRVGQDKYAELTVNVAGTPPMSFQWSRGGIPLPGATNATLVVPNAQFADAGVYTVTVTNPHGAASGPPIVLSVLGPPAITQQPQSIQVTPPTEIVLSVTATGEPPLQYQWHRNGMGIGGATSSNLNLAIGDATDGGTYLVVVSNDFGSVVSAAAEVTTTELRPTSDTFALRLSLDLTAGVPLVVGGLSGTALPEPGEPLHADKPSDGSVWYRWTAPTSGVVRFSTEGSGFDTLLAVYTGSDLTALAPVTASDDDGSAFGSVVTFNAVAGGEYSIAVARYAGSGLDRSFVLSADFSPMRFLPRIRFQPASISWRLGQTLTRSVDAEGDGLSYRWYCNGVELQGQQGTNLVLPNLDKAQVGHYQARVFNTEGEQVSTRAFVVEIGPVPGVTSVDKVQDGLLLGGGGDLGLQGRVRPQDGGTAGFLPVSAGSYVQQMVNNVTNSSTEVEEVGLWALGGGSRWLFLSATTNGTMLVSTEGSGRQVALAVFRWSATLEVSANTLVAATNGVPYSAVQFPALAGQKFVVGMDTEENERGLIVLNAAIGMPPWGAEGRPEFTSLPPEERCQEGTTVPLQLPAEVVGPVTCQWYKDGRALAGATGATLELAAVSVADGGLYTVEVANGFGEWEVGVKRLVVEVPLTVSSLEVTEAEGAVQLEMRGNFGQRCVLERASELAAGTTWVEVGVFTNWVTGGVESMMDANGGNLPQGYYRVRQVE